MAFLRSFLDEIGIDRERFRFEWIAGSEGGKFARVIQDMVDNVRRLGPFRPESLAVAGGGVK
jgi:F420-non-reducing hydrogenase iron-sulfur subunit